MPIKAQSQTTAHALKPDDTRTTRTTASAGGDAEQGDLPYAVGGTVN